MPPFGPKSLATLPSWKGQETGNGVAETGTMARARALVSRGGRADVDERPAEPATPLPHPRWVIGVVSLVTVAIVVVQLGSGLTLRNGTWPVPGFPMFREERTFTVDPQLIVTTVSGKEFVAGAHDFGLTRHQYVVFMTGEVADRNGHPRRKIDERMSELVSAWEGWNDQDAVRAVLVYRQLPLDPDDDVQVVEVARWAE